MIMTLKKKLLISLLLAIFIPQGYAVDRALLVGIDDYWYLGVLKGSTQDVKDMQQFIQFVWHYGSDQVRTLIDAQATRKNILEAFDNWLIKDSRPGDRVLFYFSGHGYYIPDDNGDESDGYDETLCPVDTRGTRTMIRDDEINARLQRLKERKVTVIIDASHSGSMTEDLASDPSIKVPVFEIAVKPLKRRLSQSYIEQDGFIEPQKNVIAYSAVAPNQVALVDTTAEPYRGVFTRNFLRGIQEVRADSNSDGKITHNELLEYIRRESQSYCDKNPLQCKAKQLTPQLKALPEILSRDALTGITHKTYNTVAGAASLFAHDNEAHLQIKTLPQHHRFKIGETIKIQISSERNGYLLLFDISSKGVLTCLFPNQSQLKNEYGYYLKAGQTLTISSSRNNGFNMAETPLGKGLLIALLVEDKILKRHELPLKALEPVPAKQALIVLQQLRQQLNQTLRQENAANRSVHWGAAVFEYELISAKRIVRENLENLYHPNSTIFTKIREQ